MYLPTRLLKITHCLLAFALVIQPILAAVPTPVAYAAPAETAPAAAAGPAYPAAVPAGPLVATVPVESDASGVSVATQAQVEETLRTAPIMFIESDNQPTVSEEGKQRSTKTFQMQGGAGYSAAGSIWLAPDAMWVTLLKPPAEETMEERLMRGLEAIQAVADKAKEPVEGVNLKISFDGANPNPRIEGFDPLDTTVSYFIGNDPDQWRTDVPVWGGVRYTNLYPGVDLVVSSKDGAWDWKLEVKEDASTASDTDPLYKLFSFDSFLADSTPEPSPLDAVSLRIEGAEGLDVLSSGEFALQPVVEITTNVGEYALPLLDVVGAEPDPAVVTDVAGEVVEAPFADAAVPKVMARTRQAGTDDLVYSTYLGGIYYDVVHGIAVDSTGAAYVTGYADSTDFPVTPGAFQTPRQSYDAYVTKISSDGRALVYSAKFGGMWFDGGSNIAVDVSGAAYVIGQTESPDFPVQDPIQPHEGIYDAFVTKLSPAGDALVYSTYLGGSLDEGDDWQLGIAVDALGSAYVTGGTSSDDFPVQNPYQSANAGAAEGEPVISDDAFVAKLAPSGHSLVYSTYLGGPGYDIGYDIAVDNLGFAYVVGITRSTDFPRQDPVQPDLGGDYDAFVTKFTPAGNEVVYSTYLGGSGSEDTLQMGIAVDASGAAYVTGTTQSTDFPRENPCQSSLHGSLDAFITKLPPSGSPLVYCTYLGGSGYEGDSDIAVDASEEAYVSGVTTSDDFPTQDLYQSHIAGSSDAFVTKLSSSGSTLLYSTYLGGSDEEGDWGVMIAIDDTGAVTVAGGTESADFPLKNPLLLFSEGWMNDTFVTKLCPGGCPAFTDGQTAGVREADYNFDNYGAFAQGQVGGEPINTRTGKHTDYEVDLSIPTLAGPLSFERSYSTENARDVANDVLAPGVLSPGWNHNYEVHLILPAQTGGKTELYTAGGSRLGFVDNRAGSYVPDAGVGGTLTRSGAGTGTTYVYRNTSDMSYTFDDEGILQNIDDGIEHKLTLVHNTTTGLLTEVYSSDSLRALFFGYDAQDRLDEVRTAIVEADGTWVSDLAQSVGFAYSTGGDLETVTDLRGQSWGYSYDDPAHPHFLTARTEPNEDLIIGIEYDEEGWAISETNGAGQTIVELTYKEDDITTIDYGQDAVGGSIDHQYDARDTLISQTDGAGGETRTEYAISIRPKSVTDPDGNETIMEWSYDGADLLSVTDAKGNETVTEYDNRHNPTLVTNPDGTQTRFVYNVDGATNPLPPHEPIGNSAWDEDVLLLSVDNYKPGETAVDANRVTRYDYNGQSLLTKVTLPDGTATCTTYTALGQPEEVTENCTSSTGLPGENTITSYSYDDLGRALTITDPIDRVTKVTYFDDDNLADRVIANYDISQPAYAQGLYNLATRTYRDALGRAYATVTNYDNISGDLTASEIAAGLPARNLVNRVYFDAAGRVETSVQNFVGDLASPTPPGFDPATPDRNLVSRTVYDGAGRVAATIDNFYAADLPGGGAPAPIDLNGDGSGDVTLEVSPEASQYNAITRITYDAASRVQTTTTAAWPGQPNYYLGTYNLVSAAAYDLASNVTQSITNYDPNWTDGDGDAFTVSTRLSPDEAPVSLRVDPDAPDRNVIACAEYDVLNRPEITRAACLPGQSTDYLERDGSLYNLVSAAYYDEMGRVYATVDYYSPGGGSSSSVPGTSAGGDFFKTWGSVGSVSLSGAYQTLAVTNERNFITRTYYDELGRVTYTAENFAGDIESTALPVYNPATPDRNLITGIFYNTRGYPAVTVHNLDTPTGLMPDQARIEATGPDRNLVTVNHYNAIGQPDWVANNFVGDLSALPATPPAFDPGHPDRNLVSTTEYDELGRSTLAAAVRGAETRDAHTTYDLVGRTTETVLNYVDGVYSAADPDADIVTRSDYLSLGRIVTVTGTTGQSQRTRADALGRVTLAVADPGGLALTTTTDYDAAGRLLRTVTENEEYGLPANQVTEARYDALGRAIQTIADPDGGAPISTSAAYDLLGRVVEAVDPMNIITRSLYDNLGRPRRVYQNFTGGAPVCNQQPNVAADANICTTYAYDDAGNLTSTTLGNGSTTEYQYDALGRVRFEIIDPNGKAITTEYFYDAAGNRTYQIRAPGSDDEQVTQTVFDRLGRVTAIHYADPALDVTTAYDAWGGRASMDDAAVTGLWRYEYDDMNRLTGVENPDDVTVSYAYDGAGQRTGLALSGEPAPAYAGITYTYDLAGRLRTITDPFDGNAPVTYGFDDASRLTSVTRPGKTATTYDYDIFGRLDDVTNTGSTALSSFTYTLDARGNRIGVEETLTGSPLASAQPAGLTPLGDQFSVISDQFNSTGQSPDFASLNASPLSLGLNQPFSVQRPAFIPAVQSSISNQQSSIDIGPAVQSPIPAYAGTNQQSSIPQQLDETETPVPTATPTETPSPPSTPTATASPSPTPTATMSPTSSPTATPTSAPTATPTSAPAGTFVVNSSGDGADSSTVDGICADATGACTLRAAIQQANATTGIDTITFNLSGPGPYTIQPLAPLPAITDPVVIDGASQPGYAGMPLIRLDGSQAGGAGLAVTAGGSTLRGLVIDRFAGAGIRLSAGGGNVIQGNFIGADVTGTLALGNGTGVEINGSANNLIGGTDPDARNVISGNSGGTAGIYITGGAGGNRIEGNFIGTDVTGTLDLGNAGSGVIVWGPNNIIGGTEPGAGNVISGNSTWGVWIVYGGGNRVQGNIIGTDPSSSLNIGNAAAGVYIWASSNNLIGGTTPGAGNVIAYNNVYGVSVTSLYGMGMGNTVRGNSIFSNAGIGISTDNQQSYPILSAAASDSSSTTVQGTLSSAANKIFALDFYASPTCDPSGYGEGQTTLGAGQATTDAGGNASFSITVPTASPDGWAITATATDPGGNTSGFSACVTVISTAPGAPPQSDDPIFDAIALPHDPALGPLWDGENLTADHPDAYHADFTLDGVSVFGLTGSDPLSASARFLLTALRQGGTTTTLPVPDPMSGNPDAVNGWLVQDNLLLRPRQTDLYEIASTQAEGVELAYLLTAPTGGTGDLEMVVGLDTTLEAYAASEGIFLLDTDGNGLYISGATAIDANGDSIAVAVQSSIVNQQSSMSLVVPGDWLSTAAYPVLVDPRVVRWQTRSDKFTPAIAYDEANNRALIAYVSGDGLYTRLVSAESGATIHEARLDTFTCDTAPSTIFGFVAAGGQDEYLVACGQGLNVSYWRVNTDGYQLGDKIPLVSTWLQVSTVDIASAGDDAGLVVWSDGVRAQGLLLSLDGTPQGNIFTVSDGGVNPKAAVDYDATLGASGTYVVAWQRTNLLTSSEIWARTVTPSGTMGNPFQVSDDAGKEFDPDVAYSASAGQTLVVWSSEEADGQAIQARRMSGGVPVSPVFMVSQTPEINQLPRAAASENSNWVVTWQRTVPSSDDKGDIWLSPVPSDASGDLTTSNRSIRVTPDSQTRPSVALRYDAVPMVALVETTSVGSAIVLVIDTPAPVGDYAWHYEYDDLGRMTFACTKWYNGDCQGNQWQYSHDSAGNLLLFEHWDAERGTTVIAQYVVNGANQIVCIDDASGDGECDDGEFSWVYDAYGHLLNDSVTRYTYDAAGRLSTTTIKDDAHNDVTTTYVYNGDGERVSQSVDKPILPDTVTTYTLDVAASTVLSETTTSNVPSTSTTHYLNGLAPIAQSDGTTPTYFQYDGTGSVRQMADADGLVLSTQTFDPYGNPYPAEKSILSLLGFGGGSHDANGLVYANGKYYAPTQGRGIQQNLDELDRVFSTFNWGGPPDTQPAPKTEVDWNKTQAFFSSLPSTAGEALPPLAMTAFKEVIVEPPLWVHSMGVRQHHLMNYDTYYGAYGGAGKYLYVQDMAAQTGDIANAAFAAFDAITWWNGIGTETVIARQALGRLGLTADEYAVLGMNADEVVRLAKMQQLETEAVIAGRGGTLPHDVASEILLLDMASQELQNSCGPACVRELLRRRDIVMSEKEVIELIGSFDDGLTGNWELAAQRFNSRSGLTYTDEIGKFVPEKTATFDDPFIAARQWKEPWIAQVKPGGSSIGHAVIVEESQIRNGKWWVIVSDPWPWASDVLGKPGPAIQYPMTWDSFLQYWRAGRYGGLFPLE